MIDMTICIAAISENGKHAVMISDKMITIEDPFNIQYEPRDSGKIDEISSGIYALTAGSALYFTDMLKEVKKRISHIQDPTVEQVAQNVAEVFKEKRLKRAEELYLEPRGLDLQKYYEKIEDLPESLLQEIDRSLIKFTLELSIILCGKSENSYYRLYGIESPGIYDSFDSVGFATIGIGDTHSTSRFTYNRYSSSMSLEESLLISYLAKKDAESAPGVGKETVIRVLNGEKNFNISEDKIKILDSAYENRKEVNIEMIRNLLGDLDDKKI